MKLALAAVLLVLAATPIMLALAGVTTLEFVFQGLVLALMFGWIVVLVATRSLLATAVAAAVLVVGAVAYLWDGSAYGWAALLAMAPFADKLLGPGDEGLVGRLARPRAEL